MMKGWGHRAKEVGFNKYGAECDVCCSWCVKHGAEFKMQGTDRVVCGPVLGNLIFESGLRIYQN